MSHRHHNPEIEKQDFFHPGQDEIADISIPQEEIKNWKRALSRGDNPLTFDEIQLFVHHNVRKNDLKAHEREIALSEDLVRLQALLEGALERKLSPEEKAMLSREAEKILN